MWEPFRLPPKLPVQAMQTYQAVRPLASHTRRATCQEVECAAYARGWTTVVDVSDDLGRRRANYIRLASGRAFTHVQQGQQVTFTFPAGQRCFADHRVNVDKPTIYLKRGGDWRAQTSEPIRMTESGWVDDQANHLDGLRTIREKG